MELRTVDGRLYLVKPGHAFACSIYEDEYFPMPRSDIFAVGFMKRGDPPSLRLVPRQGDSIAVDLQGDGPFGTIWLSAEIAEVVHVG